MSTLLVTNAPSRSETRLLTLYMECLGLQSLVIGFPLPVNTYVAKLSTLTSHGILLPFQVFEGVDVTSTSLMTSVLATKTSHTTK
ncbi:hypothetical protein N8843_06615 [Verrucomicrobia bacterium]|nr:hypothetical protein [Verrucomicrobiota bacterium]